jgi:hypothetical protein
MGNIDEATAWDILDRYIHDCLKIDSSTLLAVYATGSLPGGYYRPGQSDIDAALIVANGSERIWGDSRTSSPALVALNAEYKARYAIPKDFGPFPLQERELYPPYPEREIVPEEIARLKLQGKRVYGAFNVACVPMPTAEDFLQSARLFEQWFREEWVREYPLEKMSATACVNCILMYLGRFLRIKCGVIEFNKRKIVEAYLAHDPPFVDGEMFETVNAFLATHELAEPGLHRLRRYVVTLREQMNGYLGIAV